MGNDQLQGSASSADSAAHKESTNGHEAPEKGWIWGFGSLVYRPGFAYQKKVFGYVRGWRCAKCHFPGVSSNCAFHPRVFWQGSTDHRGVPGAAGRVATMVQAGPDSLVWGTAYRIAGTEEQQQHILKVLEHREKQYDVRLRVNVHVREGGAERVAVRGALVFIASDSPQNSNWLGPAEPEAIAQQIAQAVGPSGANCEYVYRLAEALREHGAADEELEWLAERVQLIRRRPAGSDMEFNALEALGRQRPDLLDD